MTPSRGPCAGRGRASAIAFVLGMLAFATAVPALAAEGDPPDWIKMGLGLLGGLALFLYGMEQMTAGLKAAAGEQMKYVLGKLSANRVMGAVTGAIVTAVIQSSSVTTVLVVGFVSAGLMSMMQSIGIIFGANVGTTVTAQIVAFNVTEAALPMITVGFVTMFVSKEGKARHYGAMIMGLGLIFFGMGIMGDAMRPLRSHPPFIELMQQLENPLLGILVAALFTALVQSSSATISLAVVMATQGFVTLPAGIAIVFGAKIGTCVTALLASIGKPREAVRAAAVHVTYNILGALIWLAFIDQLAGMAVAVSPSAENLEGAERLAEEVPRQIANAASIWATANVIIFLPFVGLFSRLVQTLIPDRVVEERVIVRPKFLDDALMNVPALALERARLEIGHMGEWVRAMLEEFQAGVQNDEPERFNEVAMHNDRVVVLRDRTTEYLRHIGRGTLTDEEADRHAELLGTMVDVESLAEVINRELVPIGQTAVEKEISASEVTGEMLQEAYRSVCSAVDAAFRATVGEDQRAAQEVLVHRDEFWRTSEQVMRRQAERLALDDKDRLLKHRVQTDVLDKLRRIHMLAVHLAARVLPVRVVAKELEAQA